MTPAAHIPMHTPAEAIAELEHAVGTLGLKAIMINGLIHRPILGSVRSADLAGPVSAGSDLGGKRLPSWGSGSGERLDCLGLDSAHDYDPFWRRCVELRVVPASHTPGMGWGSRRSVSNYMANHLGSFGASMEAQCRALFMGGVTKRFPQLAFGLLEGGVSWACQLLGLESALSLNEIRPNFLGPPHPGVRDLGLIFNIFLRGIFVKQTRNSRHAAERSITAD